MINRAVSIACLIWLLCPHAHGQQSRSVPKERWTTEENFLQDVFILNHTSGSVILSGTCESTQQGDVVVSDTISDPPWATVRNVTETMKALAKQNPNLTWAFDEKGRMRVDDKRVAGELLKLGLKRVDFTSAVDPNAAIRDVLAAPEVREYLKKAQMEQSVVLTNVVPSSTRGLPKLSGTLYGVTVEEALDKIEQFFPGVWIYSECREDSHVRFSIRGVEVGFSVESKTVGKAGKSQ